jgi:hypothetical protein
MFLYFFICRNLHALGGMGSSDSPPLYFLFAGLKGGLMGYCGKGCIVGNHIYIVGGVLLFALVVALFFYVEFQVVMELFKK